MGRIRARWDAFTIILPDCLCPFTRSVSRALLFRALWPGPLRFPSVVKNGGRWRRGGRCWRRGSSGSRVLFNISKRLKSGSLSTVDGLLKSLPIAAAAMPPLSNVAFMKKFNKNPIKMWIFRTKFWKSTHPIGNLTLISNIYYFLVLDPFMPKMLDKNMFLTVFCCTLSRTPRNKACKNLRHFLPKIDSFRHKICAYLHLMQNMSLSGTLQIEEFFSKKYLILLNSFIISIIEIQFTAIISIFILSITPTRLIFSSDDGRILLPTDGLISLWREFEDPLVATPIRIFPLQPLKQISFSVNPPGSSSRYWITPPSPPLLSTTFNSHPIPEHPLGDVNRAR